LGSQEKLYLGNLEAVRDWGYAPEYVESMWKMMQQEKPDDYVVATGVGASVRDFVQRSFQRVGLDWEKFVEIDSRYQRPTEVEALIGDASYSLQKLGWKATTHWEELADLMVDADLDMERQKSS
jgi:GDPmannose 4,6-dehydratase